MATTTEPRIFEELAEFLSSFPVREQVLAFRPSPDSSERARMLLWRANSGEITAEEQDELADFGRAELLVRMLKARV